MILQNTHNLMKNIKNNPSDYNKKMLWEYFIKMQIDILSTEINNKFKIIETDFGISGFIVQLFQFLRIITFFV
jgi:hypothetical protein